MQRTQWFKKGIVGLVAMALTLGTLPFGLVANAQEKSTEHVNTLAVFEDEFPHAGIPIMRASGREEFRVASFTESNRRQVFVQTITRGVNATITFGIPTPWGTIGFQASTSRSGRFRRYRNTATHNIQLRVYDRHTRNFIRTQNVVRNSTWYSYRPI